MQAGAWDPAGFLLPGESLASRLAADAEACSVRQVDPLSIGSRLVELLATADSSDVGRPERIGEFLVSVIHQRGLMTCPWAAEEFAACPVGPGGRPTANRFRIVRAQAAIEGYELFAHLIGAHGFFGGIGTRYRLEPERLMDVMQPGSGSETSPAG